MKLEKYDFLVQFDMIVKNKQLFKLGLARSYTIEECEEIINKILKDQT